jgi:hypothetical protein
MNVSFEKVNVALTRVKTREDLSLMPVLPGQSLDHLYCLRPDPSMQVWRAGFGPDGNWSPELCKSAIDCLPPDFLKKGSNLVHSRQSRVFNKGTMTAPASANPGETPALMLVKRMQQHFKRVKTAAIRAEVERTSRKLLLSQPFSSWIFLSLGFEKDPSRLFT